jgi:hypothetical protein
MWALFDGQKVICSREPSNDAIGNCVCAGPAQRTLPYERHSPSLLSQTSRISLVARNRLIELAQPKFRSRRRHSRVSASLMPVPKTALDQYCCPPPWKNNIRGARQTPVVQTKAQAARVESTPKGHFGAGMLAPDACHHAGAGRGINDVNQIYPLAPFRRPGKAAL